jgi:hypothetical protein
MAGDQVLTLPDAARCRSSRTLARVPMTCVHDLAQRLVCQKCKRAEKHPAATLLQLTPRSRNQPG